MHGKILRYSSSNGNGVIINASKRIFDFKKESWHDKKMMPAVGMLVEFRISSENGFVSDCRASKYQKFKEDSVVKEADFWRSETDLELQNRESDAREAMVSEIFKNTDYTKVCSIDPTSSIQDCIKNYYSEDFNTLEYISQINLDSENSPLKYLLVKRFLSKAIDHFLFLDKTASSDIFFEYTQMLNRLEYSYEAFSKNKNIDIKKIYEECFLDRQYNYRAALRAISAFRDKILHMQNKIKFQKNDIRAIEQKIESGRGDKTALMERKKHIEKNMENNAKELPESIECLNRLTTIRDDFYKKNEAIFEGAFTRTYKLLTTKTVEAMDICATKLDDTLWREAMSSKSVKNTFFRNRGDEPYSTMAFLGQYVKMLKKGMLSSKELLVFNYYHLYREKTSTRFLIFTENTEISTTIKVEIMSQSKYNLVSTTYKEAEVFTELNKFKYKKIFLEKKLNQTNPTKNLEKIKKKNLNSATEREIIKS